MEPDSRENHEKEFKNRLKTASEHRENEEHEKARAELIQALAYAEMHLGPESDEFGEASRRLAGLHGFLSEPDAEREVLERLLSLREGHGDPLGIVDALQDLAFCHDRNDRDDEAEAHFRRAVDLCDEQNQAHNRALRLTLLYLGEFLSAKNRHAEAIPQLERGLHVCAICDSYPSIAGSRLGCALGLALLKSDRDEEGAVLLDHGLAVLSHRSQPSTRNLVHALHVYANRLQRNDQLDKADAVYTEALYHLPHSPEGPVRLGHLLQAAASNDRKRGNLPRAERRLHRAIRLLLLKLEPHSEDVLGCQQDLMDMLIRQQRYADAETELTKMVQAAEHPDRENDTYHVRYLNNLGFVQVHLEEFPKAEANLRRGLARSDISGEDRAFLTKNLALMYQKMGYAAEAIREYEIALQLFETASGPEHPMVEFIRQALAELRSA
jgi:tetratricopeptide (TPR) repeat protein